MVLLKCLTVLKMIGFNHLGRLGRLGNQMFQYAALKGIAKNRGYDFCIPYYSDYVDDGMGNLLKTELFNVFNLKVDNLKILNCEYINEPHFHFSEELFNNCPDNISLVGFFQSEKYFKNIENEIREEFSFKSEIHDSCLDAFNTLDLNEPIALHIRRGDYTTNSDRHPVMPIEYYEKALSNFSEERDVVVFSDDPKWCSEQSIFSSDRFLISEGNDTYHDLCLMTMCSDFIIANSSFSWWGAWLANGGNVYYPSIWFGPAINSDSKDLFPREWIKIDL